MKYNLKSLENESTIHLYRKRLNEGLTEADFSDTEIQYQYLLNKLHIVANEALGEKSKCHRNIFFY